MLNKQGALICECLANKQRTLIARVPSNSEYGSDYKNKVRMWPTKIKTKIKVQQEIVSLNL